MVQCQSHSLIPSLVSRPRPAFCHLQHLYHTLVYEMVKPYGLSCMLIPMHTQIYITCSNEGLRVGQGEQCIGGCCLGYPVPQHKLTSNMFVGCCLAAKSLSLNRWKWYMYICQWVAPGNIRQLSSVSTDTAFNLGLMKNTCSSGCGSSLISPFMVFQNPCNKLIKAA